METPSPARFRLLSAVVRESDYAVLVLIVQQMAAEKVPERCTAVRFVIPHVADSSLRFPLPVYLERIY